MAIPGLKPELEVRAKVRIGEKKVSAKGKEYPAAADHFICDEADFLGTVGTDAKRIRIFLPFPDNDDNFSTGLEWWRGKQLTCYSKGETIRNLPVAYRIESMVGDATILAEEKKGKERRQIHCPVRECPILKAKDCKPMGRLQFFIDGIDPSRGVYQLDTKSWNSIEKIEGVLALHPDPRGVPFFLTVEMVSKGRDRYPVVTLEADVEVNSPADAEKADALVQLAKALADEVEEPQLKVALAFALDQTIPGWRDSQEFIDGMKERFAERGVAACAAALLEKHL